MANANGTTSYLSALSDTEWASLAKFERTFGIRQLSDYTAPSPAHGLNVAAGATQDGNVGTLTPLGKAAFPYLKGPVPIANDDPRSPRRSATPRRRSTGRTGRPSSPGPAAPPTSGSTPIPTTGARRW